jgi:hypothetical protein
LGGARIGTPGPLEKGGIGGRGAVFSQVIGSCGGDMALPADKKLRAERVIATFRTMLSEAHGRDVEWTRRYRSGEEGAMDELLSRACADAGMTLAEYHDAVDRDAQLVELQRRCVREVLLGTRRVPAGD